MTYVLSIISIIYYYYYYYYPIHYQLYHIIYPFIFSRALFFELKYRTNATEHIIAFALYNGVKFNTYKTSKASKYVIHP